MRGGGNSYADVIACIVDGQPPLPQGLDGCSDVAHYVEFMTGHQQQEHEVEQEVEEEDGEEDGGHEGGERVAAYIKGGVVGWQGGQDQGAFDDALERTLQL